MKKLTKKNDGKIQSVETYNCSCGVYQCGCHSSPSEHTASSGLHQQLSAKLFNATEVPGC